MKVALSVVEMAVTAKVNVNHHKVRRFTLCKMTTGIMCFVGNVIVI